MSKRFLLTFILFFFLRSAGNIENDLENNTDGELQEYIQKYSLQGSQAIDSIKIEQASFINDIQIPAILYNYYSSSNLILSGILHYLPVDYSISERFWVSHLEFGNDNDKSFFLDFKMSYNRPFEKKDSQAGSPERPLEYAYNPYSIFMRGNLLKGNGTENLSIEGWAILKFVFKESLTCNLYLTDQKTQKTTVGKCKNINKTVLNKIEVGQSLYLVIKNLGVNGFAILFPKKEDTTNSIFLQDLVIDPLKVSQIPFYMNSPSRRELIEANQILKNYGISKKKFIFHPPKSIKKEENIQASIIAKNEKSNNIAIYKTDSSFFDYSLKSKISDYFLPSDINEHEMNSY